METDLPIWATRTGFRERSKLIQITCQSGEVDDSVLLKNQSRLQLDPSSHDRGWRA